MFVSFTGNLWVGFAVARETQNVIVIFVLVRPATMFRPNKISRLH